MSKVIAQKTMYTDVLIVGDGISGRIAACICAESGVDVVIATKGEQASNYILGFNAAVSQNDSISLYSDDTYCGGKSVPNRDIVTTMCSDIIEIIPELEMLGLHFDKCGNDYDLLRPLGCTVPRLLHSSNKTGKKAMELLGKKLTDLSVETLTKTMLTELIVENNKISGALLLDLSNEQIINVEAKAVVLACGGIHIASGSTYPESMTGDGYAAAYRAGAELCDMEFIQFEPCRCVYPKPLGISTTLLTKGGKIYNADGERFLLSHFKNEGGISKDQLARMIETEIQAGKPTQHNGVYLDLTDIPKEEIIEKHSLYYQRFLSVGIDLTKDKIEVAPSAHSYMGGVVIDKNCQTNIQGLFACGEVTGGLHGANRVGGNAGTEVFVFGKRCGITAVDYAKKNSRSAACFPTVVINGAEYSYIYEKMIREVREIMRENMSPVRCESNMKDAYCKIKRIYNKLQTMNPRDFAAYIKRGEALNTSEIAMLSCKAALSRQESRGVHFRSDFPEMNQLFRGSFHIKKEKMFFMESL